MINKATVQQRVRWNYTWKLQANTTHETAIWCNPHNSSNLYSRVTRQFGYKHLLSKYCVHKKFSLNYCKNIQCLSVGLLMIRKVVSLSRKTVYQWLMTNCCFMSNMWLSCTERHPTPWKLVTTLFSEVHFLHQQQNSQLHYSVKCFTFLLYNCW